MKKIEFIRDKLEEQNFEEEAEQKRLEIVEFLKSKKNFEWRNTEGLKEFIKILNSYKGKKKRLGVVYSIAKVKKRSTIGKEPRKRWVIRVNAVVRLGMLEKFKNVTNDSELVKLHKKLKSFKNKYNRTMNKEMHTSSLEEITVENKLEKMVYIDRLKGAFLARVTMQITPKSAAKDMVKQIKRFRGKVNKTKHIKY